MRRIVFLFFCVLAMSARSQRITQRYENVPLSQALRELNELSRDYEINFLYDELEDFRVTVSLERRSVPEAVRLLVGFYPIRVEVIGHEIYVECPQKSAPRYTGTVVDEQGEPLAYANIALLAPEDSALITGGMSNDSGVFVVPCEQRPVVARISYVGCKTHFVLCENTDLGTVRMRSEAVLLDGVQVTAEQVMVTTHDGHLSYLMPPLLKMMPADNAYEALKRIPGIVETSDGLMFCGRPLKLIINGRPTTLSDEQVVERLKSMPAETLAQAEVMPSAPAKYHVRGMALNVLTKDFAGTNQLSGQLSASARQDRYTKGYAGGSLLYNRGRLGVDVSYKFSDGKHFDRVEHEAHHPLGADRVHYADRTDRVGSGMGHDYRLGLDYAFSASHRLGVAYTGQWSETRGVIESRGTSVSTQHSTLHYYVHNVDATYTTPFGLQLTASYTNYQNPRTQHLDGQLLDVTRRLDVDSRQRIGKWLATADQSHDVGHGFEVNYGLKAQLTRNASYQTTWDATHTVLPDASSRVDYEERILNAYVGAGGKVGPVGLEASVTAEQYHTAQWNRWRAFPAVSALWNVTPRHMLNLSYSAETIYPSYWSTMSNIYYTSAYSEIWGSPGLKPMTKHEINLMWQARQRYTVLAFAQFEPDFFVQLPYQPTDRMAVIMKLHNFDFSRYYGLQGNVHFSVGKWLVGNLTATALVRHDKSSDFFDLPFDRTRLTGMFGGQAVIKLTPRWQMEFNPYFQTRAIQGVYDLSPAFQLNAALRWTSPNTKWSVVARGNNLLNNYVSTHSRQGNQDYAMRVWMEYSNGSLSAVWRIGNFKERKKKAVDTSRMGY